MIRSDGAGDLTRVVGFVERRPGKSDGERLRRDARAAHEQGQRARIKAAGQKHAHGYIADEVQLRRLDEPCPTSAGASVGLASPPRGRARHQIPDIPACSIPPASTVMTWPGSRSEIFATRVRGDGAV